MTRLTATEAGRNFSDVLNRVAAGEEIEIVRNGATVAVLVPFRRRLLSAEVFRAHMASAPSVDDGFAGDLRDIRKESGAAESHWPS